MSLLLFWLKQILIAFDSARITSFQLGSLFNTFMMSSGICLWADLDRNQSVRFVLTYLPQRMAAAAGIVRKAETE